MKKKTTRRKFDWERFLITVMGTAIGVALTFVVNGMVARHNKEQAQRLTAIMVIHDIDNTIDILKSWKEQEEAVQPMLLYALEHKDQKELIPSDTLEKVLSFLVRRNAEYHFDTSKEKIFNSDVDTWQNLGNMKFIDNVQEIFHDRQYFLDMCHTEEWLLEPIPSDEYMQIIMSTGWVTQEEFNARQWSFLRDKLHESRVAYFINVSHSRLSVLNEYIDRFTLLNEENKFIMGITDQELEDYVNSINNNGIALTRANLQGHWLFASKEQSLEYEFHSDNSYSFTNEIYSRYMKTLYWSGKCKIRITYNGTWILQRDSLILNPDYTTSDVQMNPGDIVVEENKQDSLTSWMNSYRKSTLDYFMETADKGQKYAVKARMDSSKDKMEWTDSDGEVRYLKRK